MATPPVFEDLRIQVENTTAVNASALALINGFAARVQAGIDAALAGGATAEDLAPVQAEVAALKASATALADAVAANTPAPVEPPLSAVKANPTAGRR